MPYVEKKFEPSFTKRGLFSEIPATIRVYYQPDTPEERDIATWLLEQSYRKYALGELRSDIGVGIQVADTTARVVFNNADDVSAAAEFVYNPCVQTAAALTIAVITVYRSGIADDLGGGGGPIPLGGLPRLKPRLETGNLREGWIHIEARHITGTHPQGAGDLFASGTTRSQIESAATIIVEKGNRISSPSGRIQTYQMKMTINGKRANYKLVVDSCDRNRIITMFPVESY